MDDDKAARAGQGAGGRGFSGSINLKPFVVGDKCNRMESETCNDTGVVLWYSSTQYRV